MGSVPTAGFVSGNLFKLIASFGAHHYTKDPSFMLHHAQVDRQLALWQTYHYTKWIPDKPGAISKLSELLFSSRVCR